MNILLFGASGMVGRGVLRECLLAGDVTSVVAVGRSACGVTHPKLRETLLRDPSEFGVTGENPGGFDACFFCVGATASGETEEDYTRLTYEFTVRVAKALATANPRMTFVYVSGAGADSSERGRVMWARVRGRTENALARLPFASVVVLRPGVIRPMHGVRSKTAAYRIFYSVLRPVLPLAELLFPKIVQNTEIVGRAMLNAARRGEGRHVLEGAGIRALSERQ